MVGPSFHKLRSGDARKPETAGRFARVIVYSQLVATALIALASFDDWLPVPVRLLLGKSLKLLMFSVLAPVVLLLANLKADACKVWPTLLASLLLSCAGIFALLPLVQ